MSDNPYQSPSEDLIDTPVVGIVNGTRADLRKVALYQKGIQFCILIYVLVVVARLALGPPFQSMMRIGLVAAAVGSLVFVVLLGRKAYGRGSEVVLAVLACLPIVGLIVLLTVNEKASDILKRNGIKVGLLGARLSDIPRDDS